jgi:hypothetical protein
MPTLQIGLFGLRNAGKTITSTVLYLKESGDGLNLLAQGDDTIKYLRPLAHALEKGDVPKPTMGSPTHLKWRAEVDEATYDLHTTDFPGEYLDVIGDEGNPIAEEMMAQFRQQVRDWFVHCDAILLFVDSTEEGSVRYRDALSRLLDEMARRPTLRGNTVRAVGVVFTKADRYVQTPEQLGNSDLLIHHPMYDVVQRRLRPHQDNLQVQFFLSSALGWNFLTVPEKEKAKRKVQPRNLFAAMRWAVEQAAVLVAENHKQVLDEIEEELVEKRKQQSGLLIRYPQLLKWLNRVDQQFQLSTGPCAPRFVAIRERLFAEKKLQRRSRLLAGTTAVLLLLAGGYHFKQQAVVRAYDEYDRLHLEQPGDAHVRTRLAFYEANIGRGRSWLWRVSERRQSADQLAREDRQALGRVLANEAFIAWHAEDERREKAGQQPHRHAAATNYVRQHGPFTTSERHATLTRVLDQTRLAFEEEQARWKKVANIPAAKPDECIQKIQALSQYVERTDALYVDQAKALVQTTRVAWDRAEYAELRDLSQRWLAPGSFDRLETVANDYLRPNRHTCLMAKSVNNLIREIAAMRRGKDYSVYIKQVHIPVGSDLYAEVRGYPNCSVKVTVGGKTYETKKVKPAEKNADGSFTIVLNRRLGPYRVEWGKENATVTVTTHRKVFGDDVATETINHDFLVMSQFNSTVNVTCRNGKTITVTTDCPDARFKALPGFTH